MGFQWFWVPIISVLLFGAESLEVWLRRPLAPSSAQQRPGFLGELGWCGKILDDSREEMNIADR